MTEPSESGCWESITGIFPKMYIKHTEKDNEPA